MIYFLAFIYLLVLLQAFLQLRPKQPRKAPSVSVYDYGDHCCDGIGWD